MLENHVVIAETEVVADFMNDRFTNLALRLSGSDTRPKYRTAVDDDTVWKTRIPDLAVGQRHTVV